MSGDYENHKKWRKKHPDVRNAGKKRNYENGAKDASNGGQPWSKGADLKITAPSRPPDRELAKKLGRSVEAIQIRRSRLK